MAITPPQLRAASTDDYVSRFCAARVSRATLMSPFSALHVTIALLRSECQVLVVVALLEQHPLRSTSHPPRDASVAPYPRVSRYARAITPDVTLALSPLRYPDYREAEGNVTDYHAEWWEELKAYEATLPCKRLLCPHELYSENGHKPIAGYPNSDAPYDEDEHWIWFGGSLYGGGGFKSIAGQEVRTNPLTQWALPKVEPASKKGKCGTNGGTPLQEIRAGV
eukprot:6772408-Pyramimonas_sp.AAC.1